MVRLVSQVSLVDNVIESYNIAVSKERQDPEKVSVLELPGHRYVAVLCCASLLIPLPRSVIVD